MITSTKHGIDLGYDDMGDPASPAAVFIGGLATQRTVWPDTLCDALVGRGFRVIRFDNRDMGESTWWKAPSGDALAKLIRQPLRAASVLPYTIDDMAQDVVGLLDALQIERAHVVGMSLGGRMAQAVAAGWPTRTTSLVSMMSTSGNPALPPPRAEALAALITPPKDPLDVESVTQLAIMQQRVIGSPRYPMADDYVRQIVALNFRRGNNPEGAMRQWAASVGAGDRRESLRRIIAPTLVLHGKDDPLVLPAAGEDTAANIRGAELHVLDGWGHNIPPAIGPLLADELTTFWA